MNKMIWFLHAILALPFLTAHAQQTVEEYRQQQEQIERTHISQQIDSAVYYMDLGNYTAADTKFRHVLKSVKHVPSDLTFYFGKNSYKLGQYKQSVDWLNKYIQLKGTAGQFSQEAVKWLKLAEAGLLEQQKQDARTAEELLSNNYYIDCGPTGKVYCPVCKGAHVIIKKAAFGNEYKTCPYCDEHGLLTCDEYNQLIKGALKPKF